MFNEFIDKLLKGEWVGWWLVKFTGDLWHENRLNGSGISRSVSRAWNPRKIQKILLDIKISIFFEEFLTKKEKSSSVPSNLYRFDDKKIKIEDFKEGICKMVRDVTEIWSKTSWMNHLPPFIQYIILRDYSTLQVFKKKSKSVLLLFITVFP